MFLPPLVDVASTRLTLSRHERGDYL